ncbi:S9 family peptidase [Pontibacter russatus]|uniref:S9 family peptidase n=1 Tax=Pontibacter russatus TaxID=2694929 RepID=UPI00137A2F0D|nr:S9 family peptidase [Pontibacter russatus]
MSVKKRKPALLLLLLLQLALFSYSGAAQSGGGIVWLKAGNAFAQQEEGNIVKSTLPAQKQEVILAKEKLVPAGKSEPLKLRSFSFSGDEQKLLLYTNTVKVWRLDTKGDYWVYDLQKQTLEQVGANLPASSLMFAKFSPDGKQVAYVSGNNIYVENLESREVKQLTKDGTRKRINGTFDWAYEEEFYCRDGFRWSPDSKAIAFWQLDATDVKDYLLINHTDSIYPSVMPVEYPVAGEAPSPYKIGVVDVATSNLKWMEVPGDPQQHYVPRMEWAANAEELILQQLNRKQNESKLYLCNSTNGQAKQVYAEKDAAWIDIQPAWDSDYRFGGWNWLNGGKEFLWASEKDGWRHLYRISRDGRKETLITKGNYDVMDIVAVNEAAGYIYFLASPDNATQQYLYRVRLNGKGKAERLSPVTQAGTHTYALSPDTKFAYHGFSNYYTKPASEWVSLPGHKALDGSSAVAQAVAQADKSTSSLEFFKVKTSEGVEMDAWMVKPVPFDPNKKYPIVFQVYTEPAGQTVLDQYGIGNNGLYKGNMAEDGYIYVSVDNRGTPAPKGREWRKSIYRKVGRLNIHDQAMAAQEILKLPYVDSSRVAVWGWSGGGSATLNLLFQHPAIYKTGISIAAVANQLTYDNIYQERYMGLPQENLEDFVQGSPITYAKNLRGNLLYIHGTGDDNVHYNNAEQLINELIKHNKQFQVMPYPNRTHSISEGEGTKEHLSTLFTNYLKQHCPPGGRSRNQQ